MDWGDLQANNIELKHLQTSLQIIILLYQISNKKMLKAKLELVKQTQVMVLKQMGKHIKIKK